MNILVKVCDVICIKKDISAIKTLFLFVVSKTNFKLCKYSEFCDFYYFCRGQY